MLVEGKYMTTGIRKKVFSKLQRKIHTEIQNFWDCDKKFGIML